MPKENDTPVFQPKPRTWRAKFSDAFSGLWLGIVGQKSFLVHFFFTFCVVVCCFYFKVTAVEAAVLAISVALVMALELINSSLEELSKAVTDRVDQNIDRCLKIASSAVLVAAISSVVVGCLIFGPKVIELL